MAVLPKSLNQLACLGGAAAVAAGRRRPGCGGWQQHPLLHLSLESANRTSTEFECIPAGKLACLEALLQALLGGDDRVVVVSNSTAALDIVGGLCACLGLPTCRISGATAVEGRQDVVNTFNSQHTPVRVC